MDPQQIQEAFEKLRNGIDLTDQELRNLGRGTQDFGVALEKAGVSISRGMAGFVGGLARSEVSFKALNPVVDGVVGALGEMAKTIPFAGNAVAGGLRLAAEGSKFLLDQLEGATRSFQEMSRVGALTAQGITGLRQQFLRSGQTLQGFQRTVSANADVLARFSGTVGKGAEDFSAIVGGIADSNLGDQLRRIGFTADDIGEATAGFIQQQTRLGLAQGKSQAQLIQGSKQYAEELDILARLTGQNRAEIQKQQDAALSESRFRAATDKLIAEGNERGAKALLDFQSRFAKISPGISQGIRDSLTNVSSEAARQLFQSTGGASQEIIERLKSGAIDQDQATRELQQAIQNTLPTMREYSAAVGEGSKKFIAYNEASDVSTATLEGQVLVAKKTQQEQQKGSDQLTNAAVDAQKQLEQMSRNINSLAFSLLPAASTAVQAFTETLNTGMQEIAKILKIDLPTVGNQKTAAAAGGGKSQYGGGRGTLAGSLGATAAGAAAGAATGSLLGPVGTVIGGVVGGVAGALGYDAYGLVQGLRGGPKPEDVIEFSGASGSRENFEKLDGSVRQSFIAMAQEYQKATGKKLKINSAFRSREDQERLKSQERPGGVPVAAPGTSLHEKGLAIDLDRAVVAQLQAGGYLSRFGFQHNPKDPVHIFRRPGNYQGEGYRDGGIASGPESGYQALLHGMEAIVPLANNRSIPVSFKDRSGSDLNTAALGQDLPKLSEAIDRQSSVLQQQLAKSEAMIQLLSGFASADQMKTMIDKLENINERISRTNDISSRILQVQM